MRHVPLLLAVLVAGGHDTLAQRASRASSQASPAIYFCPMHPDVTARAPGKCGRCGMDLVAGDPWNEREYLLDMQTVPAAPRAGETVRFRFRVLDPDSGQPVTDFAVVHDKRYHLFVVSQDLEHFAHIHPEQAADGAWTIDHRLPRPGYYRIYSDFLPSGGTPQVTARTIVTSGFAGDAATSVPHLVPDTSLSKTVDGTVVQLTPEPAAIVAGRTTKLRYTLQAEGRPVVDLEPYLAAWGHTLVLSEDALEYVHAHPIEFLPTDVPDPRGGPTITFDATFPRPGRYRVWTQFKRQGVVSTTSFTVEAVSSTDTY
jgi:hypothetical protein